MQIACTLCENKGTQRVKYQLDVYRLHLVIAQAPTLNTSLTLQTVTQPNILSRRVLVGDKLAKTALDEQGCGWWWGGWRGNCFKDPLTTIVNQFLLLNTSLNSCLICITSISIYYIIICILLFVFDCHCSPLIFSFN